MTITSEIDKSAERLRLTTTIAASYVGHNKIGTGEIPELLKSIFHALSQDASLEPQAEARTPAVSIKKSITPNYLICLEDGKRLKMLKRHLKTAYGLTPDEYRAKWNLPIDYPMVAPAYAEARSVLAKAIGLGRPKPAVTVAEPASLATVKRRGRKPRNA